MVNSRLIRYYALNTLFILTGAFILLLIVNLPATVIYYLLLGIAAMLRFTIGISYGITYFITLIITIAVLFTALKLVDKDANDSTDKYNN